MSSFKYQPYRGYGCRPYYLWPYPRRVRTRNGWRLVGARFGFRLHHDAVHERYGARDAAPCRRCSRVHCSLCGCDQPWKRLDEAGGLGAVYEKRRAHKGFRRLAKAAIRRDLTFLDPEDMDASHAFRWYGDWLD